MMLNVKKFLNKQTNRRGFNLVEAMVVLFIASFFSTMLVMAYGYGIRLIKSSLSFNLMYNEAMLVLNDIEKKVRSADSIYVPLGVNNAMMTLRLPDHKGDNSTGGPVEYFFNRGDHTLRMNDRRNGHNTYNIRLLPGTYYSTRGRVAQPAYNLRQVLIERADDLVRDINASNLFMVRIRLVLENPEGDTLALSSVAFNRNRGGW